MTTDNMELTLKKLYNNELMITSRRPKIPLYVAVYDVIYGLIINGELSEGDKIPNENMLAETLGVSRSTVRMALLVLQEDGFIYTIHGKGTFVSNTRDDIISDSCDMSIFPEDLIRKSNKRYESSDEKFLLLDYDDFLEKKLEPQTDESIGLIMKNHMANGKVVAFSQNYFIIREEFDANNLDYTEANKIYEAQLYNKQSRIVYSFVPVMLSKDKRDILGVGSMEPALLIRYDVFQGNKRIAFSKEFYNTNRIKVNITTGNKQ